MSEKEFIQQLSDNAAMLNHVCVKHCRNYSRADLMQDIALELWKSIGNFKNNCTFKTWAYAVARNVCTDRFRKSEKNPIAVLFGDFKGELYDHASTFELAKQIQDAKRYNCILSTIEQPYQKLFHMYVLGASFKDLEKHSGIAAGALRTRICRIKKQLRLLCAR